MATVMTQGLDERLIEAAVQSLEMYSIHLGRRLRLYSALTEPRTVEELSVVAGIDPRYAREWLEQQAVAGLVTVDDAAAAWDRRTYRLNVEQEAVLLRADHPSHVSPLADMLAGVGQALEQVAEAYRSGGGVPYSRYGRAFREGQAGINRPAVSHDLLESWLPAEVRQRLNRRGRAADLGCGAGWAAIALARRFPALEVVGIDADPASIEDTRANARRAGVEVRFECADAAKVADHGPFDLVLVLETLHDLARPTEALAAARRALAPGGVVLVADELVAEEFTAPGELLERMMYGWSVTHCLPAVMAEQPSAAVGTVIRPGMVRAMASDAGFQRIETLDVEAGFFRLYLLSD